MTRKFEKPPFWKRKQVLKKLSSGLIDVSASPDDTVSASNESGAPDVMANYSFEIDPATKKIRLKSNRRFKVKAVPRSDDDNIESDSGELIKNRIAHDHSHYKRGIGSRIHRVDIDTNGVGDCELRDDWIASSRYRYVKWGLIVLAFAAILLAAKLLWDKDPGAFVFGILVLLLLIGIVREGMTYGEGSIFKMATRPGMWRWY